MNGMGGREGGWVCGWVGARENEVRAKSGNQLVVI